MKKFLYLGFLLVVFKTQVASAKDVKIVLWEHEKEEIQTLLDDLAKKYEAKNKGVAIKRSHYKTEDLRTQYQTAALGGGGPDLVIAPNDFAGPLSLMGIIQPVNDFFDVNAHFPEVIGTVKDESGKIWGLPTSRGNHLMLFVNAKLLPKAPATVEEMVDQGKKVTKGKVYGLAYNLNEPFWFVTFMSAFGDRPLDGSKPNLGGKAMVDALAFVRDLKFKDKIVPSDCDYTCADTLFVEGKAAMTINGDWAISKYEGALKKDLIIAPLPKLEKTGKYMQPMVSGKFVFFNSNLKGESLKAAKAYAEYLASAEAQEYAAKVGGRLPSLRNVAESDVITKNPSLLASQKALEHGQPMPMNVALRAVWDAIRPQLQDVMAGKSQPPMAAAMMQKDAQNKVKEMRQ